MNIKIDPARVAIAMGLVGTSLVAGVALLLTEEFSFFFKVAAVSLIILSLLGYIVGVLIRELHEEYLNFKGVLLKKHALKVPMAQKVPVHRDFQDHDDDESTLDLNIDYAREQQDFDEDTMAESSYEEAVSESRG
ncbi:hypothetical protein LGV61_07130 [Desulfurispirillum indicum]|uniref:Uncharacterized protein n=1 Tax=Desulfurispirillum indicum (strain ATCC BAA-1389 / DSM 22839 / S5) TaxID=653733 RepID=E6W662_DESIS|nr:hypothetical protein [Desulfurispirillum indicum]ADU66098.1 hypothetical protein Selin_1363 [Desulfurispirillum indicum S5]UCZ55504.1 hypothetical protein LGV61_07130 [Desulfurispirillum indicum]